jgi:hypothetical protein
MLAQEAVLRGCVTIVEANGSSVSMIIVASALAGMRRDVYDVEVTDDR